MTNISDKATEEKLYKEPTYRSIGNIPMYAILRVGKKHKSMFTVRGFQIHMQREKEVTNANSLLKDANEILIGNDKVYKTMSAYLQGVKLRNNSVLAREVLLTSSPGFFRGLSNEQLEQWKAINREWLLKNFGDNCIYATLHKDEATWHIHALLVPKFQNSKGEYILSNTRYFNGIEKMREWQDNYAACMQNTFKSLNRGIKYSKAKHIDIKTFYSIINKSLDENDIKSLCAKAKNSELLELQMRGILRTIESYRNHNRTALVENAKIDKELKKNKQEKEVYKEAIKLLAKHYLIKEEKIKGYLNYAENSLSNSNEKSR